MFERLKLIARRLLGRPSSEWPPFLPGEPTAGVREPRWRGPGSRGSAAAVEEPDDEPLVTAVGRRTHTRH